MQETSRITYGRPAKLSVLQSGMTLTPPPFPCPINRTTLKGGGAFNRHDILFAPLPSFQPCHYVAFAETG